MPQGSVLGRLFFLNFINGIPLSYSLNSSYSGMFAVDLFSLFFYKKPGHIKHKINQYLESLVDWQLKMNVKKCCYTIFSNGNGERLGLDPHLHGEIILYNPNPVFLGITFDEKLCFNKHFENLRVRALIRLNIVFFIKHDILIKNHF